MSKVINILLNTNNTKCYFRNYMQDLYKFNINIVDHLEPRLLNINELKYEKAFNKFKNYNNYNISYNLVSNNSIEYIKDLHDIDGVVIINSDNHDEDLLFELGYMYGKNPNLPLFYANNFTYNINKFNSKNIKIPKLLCNFNNLEFYNYKNNIDISTYLYYFLEKIYYKNNNNAIKIDEKDENEYYKYNIQDSLSI